MTKEKLLEGIVRPICNAYGYTKNEPIDPDVEDVLEDDPCLDWKKKVTKIATEKDQMRRDFEAQVDSLQKAYDMLESQASEAESEMAKYFNNKYPKVNVSYKCRPLPNFEELLECDPAVLITPGDWVIENEIKKEGFSVEEKNHDEIMQEIYNWAKKKKYSYAYDWNLYGKNFPEVWEMPFEINSRIEQNLVKGADCDSWAIWLKSYFNAAGIPDWKTRIVIGNCKLGGHATLYAFSTETEQFHHMNSTYGSAFVNKPLSSLPTTDDAKTKVDEFGIYGVWFSFNQTYSWNKFLTPQDEADFKKLLGEKVKITEV